MSSASPFTLIIPAHNEAAVIERCLLTAMEGASDPYAMEIIVAANGCSDQTVAIAKRTSPEAIVLNIPEGSKTGAINAANAHASHFPRIYLDADVECNFSSLSALADALRDPDVMTAAPAIELDLAHCNWIMQAYYRAWMKQPYAKAGKGGAGCYGLSEAAIKQVGDFPAIIGDDIWIHTRFPDERKRMIAQDDAGQRVFSVVRPPKTAWQQVKIEARRMRGNHEVKREYPSPYVALAKKGGGLRGSLRSGASPLEILVFLAVKMLVRVEMKIVGLKGTSQGWARDLSSREL